MQHYPPLTPPKRGILKGKQRAEYGASLIEELAKRLTIEYGHGFNKTNLWYMRQFYLSFQNLHALRGELTWTHYRLLLKIEKREKELIELEIKLSKDKKMNRIAMVIKNRLSLRPPQADSLNILAELADKLTLKKHTPSSSRERNKLTPNPSQEGNKKKSSHGRGFRGGFFPSART
ncbi:MAG: DUF1016 N-terminal domain-containing protein [Candidatus Jettenia sp.]|nr:MAG: DUF1016 N-terminal domain-containing protein [Candidatus Jettenia sp.]